MSPKYSPYLSTSVLHKHTVSLTRNVAIAVPMMKPAMTSDQWLRYSATRLRPVRNARHMSPRDSTGLARRVPFACTVHVTYICQGRGMQGLDHLNSFFIFFAITFFKSHSINKITQNKVFHEMAVFSHTKTIFLRHRNVP